ncbi:MAG TPA: glycosyltransferase family 1 protein [Bacteroidales bacterium]|nr:glycosyltransferase family 1 protein [Bacteroidales bacterium]
MKKILFILHYPPPVHGSAVVGGLIKGSKTINSSFNCRYINLGTSASVKDIGHNGIKKILRYISLICQVKKQLLTDRPDLCYFTPTAAGQGFYKDALLIAIVKLFEIKAVFHYHNKGVSVRQVNRFDNFLYRMAFKNTRVILLSRYLFPDIQKYVPEEKVYYCPNGIPETKRERQKVPSYAKPKVVKKGKSEGSVVELLFLSHLIESKGVFVLIDACSLLRDRGIKFHCTIAGGDAELTKQDVETIVAEKELSSIISVVGPKHGEEKIIVFSETDIFILPTFFHNECMPLALLEAMQYSLPILSTFEGAIPDVVDNGVTGFLVPQKDVKILAEKLETLIKDSDLRKSMGAAGRAKYEREFTLERFENRMAEILNQIANA